MNLENACTADKPDNQCKDGNAECKDMNGLKCICIDTFYIDTKCRKSKFRIKTYLLLLG